MSPAKTLVIGLGSLSIMAGCGKPTPAGYWEGKATAKEVPMKDHFRTLTRGADVDFWFVVEWSPINHTGSAVGEAEAVYEAELKVQNLPKVTAPETMPWPPNVPALTGTTPVPVADPEVLATTNVPALTVVPAV